MYNMQPFVNFMSKETLTHYLCNAALTAGRPGREEVRDSPGLWRLSWESMGESILEEPWKENKIQNALREKFWFREGRAVGEQRLTEDAMPLQRAGLRQIGNDAHAVASLPAVVTAEVWIADMSTQ